MRKKGIKYTVRDIGPSRDYLLREEATVDGASLNQTILKVLDRGLALGGNPVKRRDLSSISGGLSSAMARKLEASSKEQRSVDSRDWE